MRRTGNSAYLKYGALYARRTGSAAYWKGDAPAMHSAPAMRRIGNAMYRTLEPILYRLENGAPVFTILTREPAAAISFIHNRMPVILPKEAAGDWLNIRYDAGDVLAGAVQDVECWLA